ncbi:thiamine biosynthesis protein ThiC [Streptomyces sp. NPDC005407]|uniref:thiamine biosynthesis protein ThiC n=1 Tax=Streptomyces sp. NPDC005407 TaxID=3155340 RepID=UPI0033B5D7BC
MKISQDIRRQHGGSQQSEQSQQSQQEIEDGMAEKSKEFAAAGNRVYLPIAE